MPDLSREARLALSRRLGAGWHLSARGAGCRVIAGIEIDRLVATVPGSTLMGAVVRRLRCRRRRAPAAGVVLAKAYQGGGGVSGRDEVSAAAMGGSIARGAAAPLYCLSTRSRSCRPGTISAVPVVPASASAARIAYGFAWLLPWRLLSVCHHGRSVNAIALSDDIGPIVADGAGRLH